MKKSLWVGLCVALVGCANDPAPIAQLELTTQAVEQARQLGLTQANASFASAEAKWQLAQKNMAEQDYKRARVLAEQAELEARIAQLEQLKHNDAEQLEVLEADILSIRQKLGARQ